MNDTQYLYSIISPLLLFPDEMRIDRTQDEMGVLLTLHVAQDDMPRVIGRGGATALAVRRLLHQFGYKAAAHISVKIYEPDNTHKTTASFQSLNDNVPSSNGR